MNNNLLSDTKAILFIAIPMILSNISIPLLGLVDTAIVGRIGTTEIGSHRRCYIFLNLLEF